MKNKIAQELIKMAKSLMANNTYEMQWDTILNQLQANKNDLTIIPFDKEYDFYISAKMLNENNTYTEDYKIALDNIINNVNAFKESITNILSELNNNSYFENAKTTEFYIDKEENINVRISLNLSDKVFEELINEFNKSTSKDIPAIIKADSIIDDLIYEEKKIIFDHIKNDYKNIILKIY